MNTATPPIHPETDDRLSMFRKAAGTLASSLALEETLGNAIEIFLPGLGDFGFFDALVDNTVIRTARAPANTAIQSMLNQTTWQRQPTEPRNLCALSSGQSAYHNAIDDNWYQSIAHNDGHLALLRELDFSAMLTVPVRFGEELIGALTLFMGASGRTYDSGDVAFALDLAALAAPIVKNARLLAQQRHAEQVLRASEERLRLALEAGSIGIWEWDVGTDTVTWSERVYEMHGLQRDQFDGTLSGFVRMIHNDDRERVGHAIQSALAGGDLFTADFRIVKPDGSIGWLTTWAHCYRDSAGVAQRLVGSTMDITTQKLTQEQLEDLNLQLQQRVATSSGERDRIWRMSRDILAVASRAGHLVSVNPAFETILGWSLSTASNMALAKLAPGMGDLLNLTLGRLRRGDTVSDLEIAMQHSNGQQRCISWTLVPEGELIYGVGRDVTDIKRQREENERASQSRLQMALDAGGMGAWQWHIERDTVVWWPGMAALHGLPAESTIERMEAYFDFVLPEDRAMLKDLVAKALQQRRGHQVEYRVVWPDGSTRWIEGRAELKLDSEGQPVEMAGVCVDITRRKHTEDSLRFLAGASAELAALADFGDTLNRVARLAVPAFSDWCAVDMLTPEGSLERLAAAHVDPVKVKLAHDLFRQFPPDPSVAGGTWEVLRSGQPQLVELIDDALLMQSVSDPAYLTLIRGLGLRSYIGAPIIIRGEAKGVITFVSAESGRAYGREDLTLAEDIGRRAGVALDNAQLYKSLQSADRRKDEFLAMLAHELRNPLAPIRAAGDLLGMTAGDARLRSISEVVSRQVMHMTGLIDDLLDVSRVTRGLVRLDRRPINIGAVIDAAVEQVRPLILSRKHVLDVNVGTPVMVDGDEKRLVQIVANLLNNAAKYTPPGGMIYVQVSGREHWVDIRIRDNGIGMTPDMLATAFDLFAQGARTADRSQGGLGLGLGLVRSLTQLHGGRVKAFSKGTGHGSELVVELPRLNDMVPLPSVTPQAPVVCVPLSILVVDDNADAADMLGALIETQGHHVDICYDSFVALELARQSEFAACLLDIGLPGMDGMELARHIRALTSARRPFLIGISGYGQDHDRKAALAAGFDHYLIKPVAALDLDALLTMLRDERGQHRASASEATRPHSRSPISR